MNLTINDIGIYLPETTIALDQIRMEPRLSDAEIKVYQRFYGLKRVAISDISLEDMMFRAAQDALARSHVAAVNIRLLAHIHTSPETHIWPNDLLARLCRRLKLQNATVLAVHTNNCASTLSGLMLSQNYLAGTGGDGYALLLTADLTFSGILQQIPNTTLCGDAATACIISLNGSGAVMKSVELDYFGEHAKGPWQSEEEQARFESGYTQRLAAIMQRSRQQAGLKWDQIRWIFPHNVNVISWRNVAAKLNVPLSKIYLEKLPELGHCFGADIFINWRFASQTLQPGDHIMVATVGLGAIFGSAVFQLAEQEPSS
ncbi:3-oxoacyl-ACP synthase [Xenorhabdus mauleonii]|uniref:3-oxoacyl-ACP synthase n=1 Tax=Xenorhabdus mauleonii TaxID=351675 RepID=A0A1I3S7U4_9GAMM|nr:ketoacyl-ACP synthase III family protein [Xenorhabdus mauleonii]PHM39084.1 3-oxoacyl-ACP synthase [Xenorhabdus mauleonii]SFJ54758.1 3-oxoacyl-[acyl-carrier-protein] synthase-3 [Xenorhabdus mauleonii]